MYDSIYMRSDVAQQYTENEINGSIENPDRIDKSGSEHLHPLGELEALVRWFEEGIVVHIPHSGKTGTAISFDKQASPQIDVYIDAGLKYFEEITSEDN